MLSNNKVETRGNIVNGQKICIRE